MSTYMIVRFTREGPSSTVVKRGLTLEEAKKHCSDPATSGDGWFDGWTEEVE